ncbi:MAG: hypothetical protein PHD45_08530 [Bacteroidales bacterium]|nr:hypothetical protein [Bacteroidales bacterium]
MQALLLTNLCFLFDKNNPQSLINASFKDAELKKLHNELLKEWDRVDEDNLKDIIKNIGFLNTFELKSMKIAHSQIRSLDKESFIITDKLIELHKLLKLHIQNIIISL